VSIEERERDPEGRTASALYRKRIYTQLCGEAILWLDGWMRVRMVSNSS
jgi:hypothetical protein